MRKELDSSQSKPKDLYQIFIYKKLKESVLFDLDRNRPVNQNNLEAMEKIEAEHPEVIRVESDELNKTNLVRSSDGSKII